jgi:hypothetical protein
MVIQVALTRLEHDQDEVTDLSCNPIVHWARLRLHPQLLHRRPQHPLHQHLIQPHHPHRFNLYTESQKNRRLPKAAEKELATTPKRTWRMKPSTSFSARPTTCARRPLNGQPRQSTGYRRLVSRCTCRQCSRSTPAHPAPRSRRRRLDVQTAQTRGRMGRR